MTDDYARASNFVARAHATQDAINTGKMRREFWKTCVNCRQSFVVDPDDPTDAARDSHSDVIDCVRALAALIEYEESEARYAAMGEDL